MVNGDWDSDHAGSFSALNVHSRGRGSHHG